jgi:hypothetical protein
MKIPSYGFSNISSEECIPRFLWNKVHEYYKVLLLKLTDFLLFSFNFAVIT